MSQPSVPADRTGLGRGLLLALGYVSMAGSLSTDLYLPSFPDITDHFGTGAATVQLTLTAFLFGAAVGQLLIGAVSDALGRRRTLILALSVFAVCAYLAAASPTIETLIAVRAVQGFAGSAGAVLGRAVIADRLSGDRAVRAIGAVLVMIALGAAIASPLGAWLTDLGGWRAALLGLAVLATGMLLVALLFISESLPPQRRHALRVGVLAGNVGRLLRRRAFVGFVVAYAAAYGAFAAYLGSSSFIVQEVLGLPPLVFSLTFSATSLAMMLGAWLGGSFGSTWGTLATLRIAQIVAIASTGAAVVLAMTGALSLPTYLPLMFLLCVGTGGVMTTAAALAIGRAQDAAGAGSAVLGFAQFLFGALASPLGGVLGTGTSVPAVVAMTGMGIIGFLAAFLPGRPRTARRGGVTDQPAL